MLFTARTAPDPTTTQLVSLCCSLNSPIISIPELPVGPASAAIAIHDDLAAGTHITVAVKCRRTDDVALFRAQGENGATADAFARTVLLWAEGMGFLFDDDLCFDAPNQKGVRNETATEIWRELVVGSHPDADDPMPVTPPDPSTVLSKFRSAPCMASMLDAATVASAQESTQRARFAGSLEPRV